MSFPMIHQAPGGFRVQTSAGAYLPGIFINLIMAEKAIARYTAKSKNVQRRGQRKTSPKSKG